MSLEALSFALLVIAIVAIGYKDVTKLMGEEEKDEKIDKEHLRKQD